MNASFLAVLDRDGVINKDFGHVGKQQDFQFQLEIFDLCLELQRRGAVIVVATNQAGIAKGLYTENDFLELTTWMIDSFLQKGVHIGRVYYCPHAYNPLDLGTGKETALCNCRKPRAGMLERALWDWGFPAERALIIGDKESDQEAGQAAGFSKRIFLSGDASRFATSSFPNIGAALASIDAWTIH